MFPCRVSPTRILHFCVDVLIFSDKKTWRCPDRLGPSDFSEESDTTATNVSGTVTSDSGRSRTGRAAAGLMVILWGGVLAPFDHPSSQQLGDSGNLTMVSGSHILGHLHIVKGVFLFVGRPIL